jgi:hypothetical protein
MNEKTSSGIALLPTGNNNGSVQFFMIKSKRIVTRDKFVVLPNIPDAIVVQMNDIARGEIKGSNVASSDKDDNDSPAASVPSHEIPTIHDEAKNRVAAADDQSPIDSASHSADTPDPVVEPDQQASTPVDVSPSFDDSSPSSEPTSVSPESSEPAPRSDRHGYRRFLYAFSMRARTALQSYSESVPEAIRLEIEQLHQKGVFEPTWASSDSMQLFREREV